MDFWTRLIAGLNLIAQLAPAIVAAQAGVPIRIRKITIRIGSTYVIAGATIPAFLPGEADDDLTVQVQ